MLYYVLMFLLGAVLQLCCIAVLLDIIMVDFIAVLLCAELY